MYHSVNRKARILSVCCMLLIVSIACNLPTLTQEEIVHENHGIKEGLVQNVHVDLPQGICRNIFLAMHKGSSFLTTDIRIVFFFISLISL